MSLICWSSSAPWYRMLHDGMLPRPCSIVSWMSVTDLMSGWPVEGPPQIVVRSGG